MLWNNDQWTELERIRQDMDNLLTGRGFLFEDYSYPPLNVYDEQDAVRVTAELAGLTKDDVEINYSAEVLTLSGRRKIPEKYGQAVLVRKERTSGAFEKSIRIAQKIDAGKITASFKDGILTVVLPRKEESKPRQIAIEA
jgi:HSP20 family protein